MILTDSTLRDEGSLTLELQVDDGTTNGMLIHAGVRHIAHDLDGTLRVGVEFSALTPVEESLLELLLRVEAGQR